MKTKLLLYFILANSLTLPAQKNDWQEYNLRGEVKTLRERSFEPAGKGKKLKTGERASCTLLFTGDPFLYFNVSGNLLEETFYDFEDSIISRQTTRFDGVIKIESVNYNEQGHIKYKSRYDYDDLSRIYRERCVDSTGKDYSLSTYLYNNEQHTKDRFYESSSDKRFSSHTTYTYDLLGNVVKFVYRRESSRMIIQGNDTVYSSPRGFKVISLFNDKNQEIQSSSYSLSDSLEDYTTYAYNLQGDVIKETSYFADGKPKNIKTYLYEYDVNSNWIRRIAYEGEIPKCIVEREIDYY